MDEDVERALRPCGRVPQTAPDILPSPPIHGRPPLKAPFPYHGGKSRAAALVWERLGDVNNYVEPFFGSGAVLLRRPGEHGPRVETVNDLDCYVSNFWRATRAAAGAVVEHADWPVNETDLHARHRWLVLSGEAQEFRDRMRTDPEYFDARIAGWWVWGICCWIGGGWCSHTDGVNRRPDLHRAGQGVNLPPVDGLELGDRRPDGYALKGVHAKMPRLGALQLGDEFGSGRGVHGGGWSLGSCAERRAWLMGWFARLNDRLRAVRVCCLDWKRVCDSPSTMTRLGLTGVFLDPPYAARVHGTDGTDGTDGRGKKNRDLGLYAVDSGVVAAECREWCERWGKVPGVRIALCGLEGEHDALESQGWTVEAWKAHGGYGNRNSANDNRERERIWFSPQCLKGPEGLFGRGADERDEKGGMDAGADEA